MAHCRTSRERPKSAPYLRLKNNKRTSKYSLLQYPFEEKLKKNTIFFEIFLVSRKSHSAETCKMGPFGSFLTSILLQNRQKNEGWTLWRYLRKKSHKAEKNLHKKILVMAGLEPMSFCLSDLEKAVVAKWQ